jgi:hypothetical protein
MKWITREYVKVDRVACPWLIKKFVDKDAEFFFVPADKVMNEAKRLGATPYDVKDVELGHHGKECSFEAILKTYKLTNDAALVLLGKIVNGADTDNTLYHQPEGPGLEAVITATGRRTRSAAIAGNRSYCPFAQRYSIATFRPTSYPVSLKPWRNARSRLAHSSGDALLRNPTIGSAVCCPLAASGHVAAAPPSSVMNSRRCS